MKTKQSACELIINKTHNSARARDRLVESSLEQGVKVGEVSCVQMREHIASNKALALAKRSAKEHTARNKAAAMAKRAVRAREPTWNITTATDAHFGISENDNDVTKTAEPLGNELTRLIVPERVSNITVVPTFSTLSSMAASSNAPNISSEFNELFCDTTGEAEPFGNELTSPDLHPVLVKDNSPEGISKPDSHNNFFTTNLKQSPDLSERNPTAHPNVPSESVTFGDKRRRLLSTPLLTGYYVSDRPPDGQKLNFGLR